MSHKRTAPRSIFRTREAQPAMNVTKEGAQILCPFCTPTHPLIPGQPSNCGTILKLTAVQDVLPTRIVRLQKIKCLKCHEGGGEMVQYMGGFVHLNDCTPGTRLLPAPPEYNPFAGMVFNMPIRVRRIIEKTTGLAQQVKEIDQDGVETGKIMGYFFMRQGITNGSTG